MEFIPMQAALGAPAAVEPARKTMDETGAGAEHFGMNTTITHRIYGCRAEEAVGAARAEAARLEGLLSRYVPGSDVSRVNRSAGKGYESVGEDAFAVLSRAADFCRGCRGFFDITVGPLVDLWRAARAAGEPPGEGAVRQVLPLVDASSLLLDPARRAVMLRGPGQSVDLGGIGKGYAADRFLEIFRQYGVASAFTNIGGNVAALGSKPDGSPWRVGIRHPRADGRLIGLVAVTDETVVTSGDYQRYFTDAGGRRWHHLLDPSCGYPAEAGLASVTVVAKRSMDADALSTALFVAGLPKGTELLKRFAGVEAIFVGQDLRVSITAGLQARFQAAGGVLTEIIPATEG